MIAQFLLILAALGVLLYFARRQHNTRMQAGKRIALFFFVALNIYAVLRPDDTTWLAHQLGIGRGADLLLYLLVVAFIFGILNTYLRFRGTSQQITELARTLAIREAELVNHQRGLMTPDHVHTTVTVSGAPEQPGMHP